MNRPASPLASLLAPWAGLPRALYAIFFARIVTALGCFVMPLQTLILTERVGLSPDKAGLILTLGSILYLPGSFIGGKLADHWGRKAVYLWFSLVACGLYAVCGLLPAGGAMVAVLMLALFFMSMVDPAAVAMLSDLTTAAQRKSAMSLSYMGWNIGFAVGPIVGGLLFEKHLAWVFWGDALTTLLGLGLVLRFVHLPRLPAGSGKAELSPEPADGTAIAGPVMEPADAHATSNIQLTEAERHVTGTAWQVLRARPALLVFSLLNFGFTFVYSQWGFLLPMQTAQSFGAGGAAFYGLLAGVNGLLVIVLTPLVTRATHRMPYLRGMFFGGLLYAVSLGTLSLVSGKPAFLLVIGLFTLGEVFCTLNAGTFTSVHTPASHRGRLSAITNSIGGAGYALGPMVMGRVAATIRLQGAWLVVGAIGMIAALSMLAMRIWEMRTAKEPAGVTDESMPPA